tara:strand:- start:224 stop:415 length:192 start_codon:yes stop_codon:yes gene_type:complete
MKITKISPIPPTTIPREHSKWCGMEVEEKKKPKEKVEISDGDLILYDKRGKLKIYKGEKNGGY